MSNPSNILIVRASGGLANRILALISGISLALLSQRTLCVDWRDGLYSDDFSNVFPQWFALHDLPTINIEEALEIYAQKPEVIPAFWHEHIQQAIAVEYLFDNNDHMLLSNMNRTRASLKDLQSSSKFAVFWDYSARTCVELAPLLKKHLQRSFPEIQNIHNNDVPQYILRKYIAPTKKLTQRVDDFFQTHFTSPPIGIHIRYTDLQSPLPAMINTLRQVANKHDSIFLCTDCAEIEKMIHNIFPNTITQSKIFLPNGTPLHSYVPGVSNVQKGTEALIDMFVLSKCSEIIHYSHSSFARIPIMYSGLHKDKIHAVQG